MTAAAPSTPDLTIRHARIVTDGRIVDGDVGVTGGVITQIGGRLAPGERDIDAAGRLLLPGGIDSHCHVEQFSGMGLMCADDDQCGAAPTGGGTVGGRCRKVIEAKAPIQEPAAANAT